MSIPGANGTGSSGVWQLFKERRKRDGLYGAADYWDSRAGARRGMARSLWPSNTFNRVWDERQRAMLARVLGPMSDRRVVDIGCGTGRVTRWLAEECGASHVVGVDFSHATVVAARNESMALVSSGIVRFEQGDVVAGLDGIGAGHFDDAVILGCLSIACREIASLERAMANVARLVRKGGRVLLLEPIHRSPLLRRVLALGLEEWIACANGAGLSLALGDRMGFVPARLVLSVRDLPHFLVAPLFHGGEHLLDAAPWLSFLADYKLLLFTRSR
ncbi:MAG: class I SAM-dependent methyltransferase [Myxococcota bacterium]|nr:class I SAM-dependent methyltransferase [Myxococcota bacterium]